MFEWMLACHGRCLPVPPGLAKPDAINDGGMIELITDDGILRSEYCLKEAGICVKAARVEYRVRSAMKVADPLL